MNKNIKVILISGTKTGCRYAEFLNRYNNVDLCLIVTGADKPYGRGRSIKRAVVAEFCDINNLKVFQPININSAESVELLKNISANMAIVIDFGQILSREVLDIFPMGSFNIHYSLLPDLRGPAPVRWALLKGHKKTGVTLMKMNEKIDMGEIVDKEIVNIDELDNYEALKEKLTDGGIKLLKNFLVKLKSREEMNYKPQPKMDKISHAPKIKKDLCQINWNLSSDEIINKIRALSPHPGCNIIFKKKNIEIKIIMAKKVGVNKHKPGEVVSVTKESFIISSKKDGVEVLKLQPSGKKIMEVKDFLAGNPVRVGDKFK